MRKKYQKWSGFVFLAVALALLWGRFDGADLSGFMSQVDAGTTLEKTLACTDGSNYIVDIYGDLPEGCELSVSEVEDADYRDRIKAAMDEKTITYMKFLDISLLKDGVEMEPENEVEVALSVQGREENPGEVGRIFHFEERKTVQLEAEDTALASAPGAPSAPRTRGTVNSLTQGLSLMSTSMIGSPAPQDAQETEWTSTGLSMESSAPEETVDTVVEAVEMASFTGSSVAFKTSSFSVYGVVYSLQKTYVSSYGETYKITVSFDNNAGIPENAELEVSEVFGDEYYSIAEQSIPDDEKITFARFFDITILADGEEVQPKAPVDVKVELVEDVEDIRTFHIIDEDEGEVEEVEADVEDGAVVFSAEGFSVYAIVGTITTEVITASGDTYEITVSYFEDAGIPDGARLYAEEIVDEKRRSDLLAQAAEAVIKENGEDNIMSARFFDVEIRNGEEVIEPKDTVTVTIKYVDPVSLGDDEEMSAIHFGEESISLTKVSPEENEEGGIEVAFKQDGFSVTGTIITSGTIANGNYAIIYKNGSDYYAMAADGSARQVYVGDSGVVSTANGGDIPSSLIWTRTGSKWRGNQNTGYYLYIGSNYLLSENEHDITINSTNDADGNRVYQFLRNRHYLGYNNGFTSSSMYPNNFYLARINNDTNITIHYGYLNDEGNYEEWADEKKTLRAPNMLGDQYDVRVDIEGFEYVTSRLYSPTSETGTDIINLLQTQYESNPDVALNNNVDLNWRYRELTDNNITRVWDQGDKKYDYKADTALNQDIYVVYRKDLSHTSQEPSSDLEDIDKPGILKEKNDNGDGTYEIDLSVTGEAASQRKNGHANIVIVLDTSDSMKATINGETKFGITKTAIQNLVNDLTRYNTPDDPNRIEFAYVNFANYVKNESMIYSVGDNNKNAYIYNNAAQFNKLISDSLKPLEDNAYTGGTCWDKAMAAAYSVLWNDDDPRYVVFISDGDTNSRAYALDNYDLWDGGTYCDMSYSTNYDNNKNAKLNVDSTIYWADRIKADGGTVFTIGIQDGGTLANLYRLHKGSVGYVEDPEGENLHFNASGSLDLGNAFTSVKNTILSSVGYQNILLTDGLTGMTSTALVDGNAGNFSYTVAKYTTETEKLQELPDRAAIGSTKDADGNVTAYTYNDGEDAEAYPYIKTVKTIVTDTKATVAKNENGTLSITFPGDSNADVINQAEYSSSTKQVSWNMGDDYQLRDGYTYTVSFTVWPNQLSYDLIADLNNGFAEWKEVGSGEDAHAEIWYDNSSKRPSGVPTVDWKQTNDAGKVYYALGKDYTDQIVKSGTSYSLKSNVESGNTVSYYKVSNETVTELPNGFSAGREYTNDGVVTKYTDNNDGTYTKTVKTPDSADFVNPDPMPLVGISLQLTKQWNDTLDPSHLIKLIEDAEEEGRTYSVTINVLQNDSRYNSYVFIPEKKYYTDNTYSQETTESTQFYKYLWPSKTIYISPALFVSELPHGTANNQYFEVQLDHNGHNSYYCLNSGYDYTLTEDDTDYHFEFSADIYHPALLDEEMNNVKFNGLDSAEILGDTPLETFVANNSLTSELDITKVIVDDTHNMTEAELDAETFTYKVTLKVPNDVNTKYFYAYEFVPRSDRWNGTTRVYAYGYQHSDFLKDKALDDDVSRFDEKVFGRYTVSYPGDPTSLKDIFNEDRNDNGDSLGTKTGILYITLKRNEVLRFTNLPLGTEYEIEEVYANLRNADPSQDSYAKPNMNQESNNLTTQGYTTISFITKSNGIEDASKFGNRIIGTIDKLDTRYYNQFTNTRTTLTKDVRAEIKVKKVVDGYDWGGEYYQMNLASGECTYNDGTQGTSPMPSNTSVKIYDNTADHILSFGNVLFTKAGTYKYTISENANTAYMPYVIFASPIEVTIIVKADETGKLKIDSVTDNSEIDGNTFFTDAAQDGSTLGSVTTTMTNRSNGISLEKIDEVTKNKINGAEFELWLSGSNEQKLYIDSNNRILTAEQVIAAISTDDNSISDLSTEPAISAMNEKGIKSSFTMGEKTLKGYSMTGYTLNSGVFSENAPIVYKLVELTAPDGYLITNNTTYFKVRGIRDETEQTKVKYSGISIILTDEDGKEITYASAEVNNNNSMILSLSNTPGAELPATGGPGVHGFIILGALLLAVSMLTLLRQAAYSN